MSSEVQIPNPSAVKKPVPMPRSIGRAALLTLPILMWSLLMFSASLRQNRATQLAGLITAAFMTALFFLMMRTGKTYRWRRWFFVSLGVLFPIGFIHTVISMRGTMGIPIEEMIAGRTPFCYMPIPFLILPAALTKAVVFPGSILPNGGMSGGGMAAMVGIWLTMTLVVGKAWCSYICFFGGIEEGMAGVRKQPILRKIDPRWRYMPWAVLLSMVLLSLALFDSVYCMWLCPFKAVSEYVAARNTLGLIQNGIFILLFAGLVIVLPFLTKKRTQCALFCPFGAFQSLFNKTSIFEVTLDKNTCNECGYCRLLCPTMAISEQSIAEGKVLMSCMKCGFCVDTCPKHSALWHIKGTDTAEPERARLLFLYAAWAMATMFGGSIIAQGLATILNVVI